MPCDLRERISKAGVWHDQVDPRVVVSPAQATELLAAMSYVESWHRARGRWPVAGRRSSRDTVGRSRSWWVSRSTAG